MSYQKILIISGGSIDDAFAADWIQKKQPDYMIAADSGMEFFYRTDIMPNRIIGDFDSVNVEILAYYEKKPEVVFTRLNPIKDDTDTEFAIRQAIELGAEEITVLGATGSRLDHVLGNISLLGIGLENGVQIQLVDAHNRIRMIKHSITLSKAEQFGAYVSLIPYAGEVKELNLKGFKYPLENYDLKLYNSLGISNEIVEDIAEITFEKGVLLVIEARD